MAEIIFHAGMPKTGSTSIQAWLAAHLDLLENRGITAMRITRHGGAGGPISLVPSTAADAMSVWFREANRKAGRPAVTAEICDAIDDAAACHDRIVLSGESYEVLFNNSGPDALTHLDALSRRHRVRVAYYVRPQHTWLESAWLQWGFRHTQAPDFWLTWQRPRIDYFGTLCNVRSGAPNLPFEMRPFRRDLLMGGNVVSDFGRVFLDLVDEPSLDRWQLGANESLPLDAAILLRGAPLGMFWSSIHDNRRLYPLKHLIAQWKIGDTELAIRSRAILQHYAYETFEEGNQRVIAELGWPTEHFVPPPAPTDDGEELAVLNDLWSSKASEAERQLFYGALDQLLEGAREEADQQSDESTLPPSLPGEQDTGPAKETVAQRLGSSARAIAATVRHRAPRTGARLEVVAPKHVPEGTLLRLKVKNFGPSGTFEAMATVRGATGADARVALAWRGSSPQRRVRLERGGEHVLRLALATARQFELIVLDETRGDELRLDAGSAAELVVAIRDENERVLAEQPLWLTYVDEDGTSVPAVSFTAPLSAARAGTRGPASGPVVDLALEAGLGIVTRTFGAVVFDANNDGWPDIFLGRHDAAAYLYRNDHGTFRHDHRASFPGAVDRHCAVAGDLTGNGRLDLLCTIGGRSGHGPKTSSCELWLQQDDGTFRNEGDQPGFADPWGRGREAVLLDATGNGLLDVLVGNVSPRSDGQPSPNRLFVNEGNGRFRPAPELGLDLEYSVGGAGRPGAASGGGNWPMGRLTTLDANGNGFTDVLMCAKHADEQVQSLHLFANEHGGGFREITVEAGLQNVAARDVAVCDVNGDGVPDLVLVNSLGLTIWENNGGTFARACHVPIEDAFRVAVGDASGDGRPDIYVMRTRSTPGPDIADLLLVRRGTGLHFESITLPTVEGDVRDDQVYAIDYDRDGRTEFLVLHGHSPHPAPLQLIKLV